MIRTTGQDVAEDVVSGYCDIVKGDRAGIGPAPAELVFIFLDLKALVFSFDDDAAIAFSAILLRPAHDQIGFGVSLRAE